MSLKIAKDIALQTPNVDYWSIRLVTEQNQNLTVRQGVLQPITQSHDIGAMFTIHHKNGTGYSATQDFSSEGIKTAFNEALFWAKQYSKHPLCSHNHHPTVVDQYKTPLKEPWNSLSIQDKITLLKDASQHLKLDNRIVDWEASLAYQNSSHVLLTSSGSQIQQDFHFLYPNLSATANQQNDTQIRSLGGFRAYCQQSGLELLKTLNLNQEATHIADEAIQLLLAKNCPTDTRGLLLAPDQMMLQIHESIGHPIELDRILGDERNYAGTSFVTLDMFGQYQYGSKLLNVTFDPSSPSQLASYAYDDDGQIAKKVFMIKNGILQTPLGGSLSQSRAQTTGVANSRASSWNRPPIDRMANLNLEPGPHSLEEIIASVEKGIYMKSNNSWSIDDSRNKFQFGCEWGQLIENGRLTSVVKNPNYRGISATFWRNLEMVGNKKTFFQYGTPYCGKGEPNQCIRVGHASPACLFANIDVFGGE